MLKCIPVDRFDDVVLVVGDHHVENHFFRVDPKWYECNLHIRLTSRNGSINLDGWVFNVDKRAAKALMDLLSGSFSCYHPRFQISRLIGHIAGNMNHSTAR
jgi:hypothetical protein